MLSTKREVNWFKVLIQIQSVFVLIIGLHLCIFQAKWTTLFFTLLLIFFAYLGQTAGAHRLWAHSSYKASNALKIFLMSCHTLCGTGSIYTWVKIHRLHHKCYGTDLDPYNPNKGAFYAHFKGFSLDLSEAQEKEMEKIDVSDLESDKIVMFQHKFYWILFLIFTVLLPINAPAEYWNETIMNSVAVAGFVRYSIFFHLAMLVHSATKILGLAPGEKFPSDTNLVFLLTKTHWISYHYLAPWDYQTGEYGKYGPNDYATLFIKMCESLNLASDLKTVDSKTVRNALSKAIDENKTISKSLKELQDESENLKDEIFRPSKYF